MKLTNPKLKLSKKCQSPRICENLEACKEDLPTYDDLSRTWLVDANLSIGYFEWDEACSNALASIKRYLLDPLVLGASIPRKPLVLYIVAQEKSLGSLMVQENEEGKERALYYLSQTLNRAELNYSLIENTCLVFSLL